MKAEINVLRGINIYSIGSRCKSLYLLFRLGGLGESDTFRFRLLSSGDDRRSFFVGLGEFLRRFDGLGDFRRCFGDNDRFLGEDVRFFGDGARFFSGGGEFSRL